MCAILAFEILLLEDENKTLLPHFGSSALPQSSFPLPVIQMCGFLSKPLSFPSVFAVLLAKHTKAVVFKLPNATTL